ncbi:MAG: Serine/threonine kinase [Labilithrix sp.]|nr:Serine/threonine kinase [Labilithrix sp.]
MPALWTACGLEVTGSPLGIDPDGAVGITEAGGTADGESEPPLIDASSLDGPPIVVPSDGGCPTGRGPVMIDVGDYCIDSTEVTQAQYGEFVTAMNGVVLTPRDGCGWKQDHVPGGTLLECNWDPVANPNLPVVCVDWCDADSFCRWAGKRLCGHISGGAINDTGNDYRHPDKDQWYRACGRPEQLAYPYGNTGMGTACNGTEQPGSGVVAVGSLAACTGGHAGMVDMSGNASEWEDSCSGPTGVADLCKCRGGSWRNAVAALRCDSYALASRNVRDVDIGFRCCSP